MHADCSTPNRIHGAIINIPTRSAANSRRDTGYHGAGFSAVCDETLSLTWMYHACSGGRAQPESGASATRRPQIGMALNCLNGLYECSKERS